MILVGFIFLVFGIMMMTIPAILWDLTESWKSKDAREPSDIYIRSSRIIGALLTILAIVGMIEEFL